jgi:outer membrane lipoprotein carrier protein
MPRRIVSFVSISALSAATLFAQAKPAPNSFDKVLKEISARQQKVTTLQADFTQEKEMALLAKPEVSSGTFVFSKPNNVLWKYESPRPVTMLITQGTMTTYYPQLKKAERVEVKSFEDRIFKYMGAASGAVDELGKYFNIKFVDSKKDPVYTLELTPKTKTIAKRVRKIRIWIDRTSYLTTKFEYVEGDGDVTRYSFRNLRINEPVPPSRFALNLPPAVRIETMKVN